MGNNNRMLGGFNKVRVLILSTIILTLLVLQKYMYCLRSWASLASGDFCIQMEMTDFFLHLQSSYSGIDDLWI